MSHEMVTRVEFDDLIRHLTTKVDRAQQLASSAGEEAAAFGAALEVCSYQIRQLTSWLIPLLSSEQQEAIGVERRGGVTDEPLVSADVVEPNDGREWRSRLKRRADELAQRARSTVVADRALSSSGLDAMRSLGARVNAQPSDRPSAAGGEASADDVDVILRREDDFLL